jgi:crotonobetainyl-CoA:carnitine CoA-transferase CaiB-like acyl-CoA transferase
MGGSILNLHRNKRSIFLNLKESTAKKAFKVLIASSDVLIHNLRPAAAQRMGLDWGTVGKIHPAIILCAARGFSSRGPYGHKAAYDDLMQASSGFAALFEKLDGEPRYAPTSWCDKVAGQAIAYAVLGAFIHRLRTGVGQAVEVPMFEVCVDFMLVEHFGAMAFEPAKGPPGFKRQLARGRKPYRTADGWACILPYSDKNWKDFFRFVGRAEQAGEARFASLENRVVHIEELYKIVEREARRFSTTDWMRFCDEAGIPAIPVLTFEDLANDEHVVATHMFEVVEHPTEGAYKHVRSPVRFADSSETPHRFAPRAGENTREVLEEVGVPVDLIQTLISDIPSEVQRSS